MMPAKQVIGLEAIGPDNHVMCLPSPKLGQSALRAKLGKWIYYKVHEVEVRLPFNDNSHPICLVCKPGCSSLPAS